MTQTINVGMDVDKGLRFHVILNPSGDYLVDMEITEKGLELALEADPDFKTPSKRILLADYAATAKVLTTYPITLNFGPYFLRPKYRHLRTIALEDVDGFDPNHVPGTDLYYERLPTGVIKTPQAGFGLAYDMRFIAVAVEAQGVDELALVKGKEIERLGSAILLPYKKFDAFRRAINRSHKLAVDVANRSKVDFVDINLKLALNPEYKLEEDGGTRRTLAELIADKLVGKDRTAAELSTAAVRTVRRSMKAIAEKDPVELMDLHREIELVTLEELIERIAKKIEQKTLTERHWQEFLTANAFVLQLAFNLPAVIFDEQVSVGGTRFDGRGGKLADYLLRLGGLGNLAIIEIKRPATKLVETTQYREGLHGPSSDLAGAVSQVLDQRHKLQLEINHKKVSSNVFDVFTYAVSCIVIAGVMPTIETEKKSLELYRHNLRDVGVITFDELLIKLRSLYEFLKTPPPELDPGSIILEDDPF
ncbi:MAG: hypothetical protein K0S56_2661 [Microvirga sp.]|jgi:hypothetical protein|nr:hypothetical protein [Microvirga sp.]